MMSWISFCKVVLWTWTKTAGKCQLNDVHGLATGYFPQKSEVCQGLLEIDLTNKFCMTNKLDVQ